MSGLYRIDETMELRLTEIIKEITGAETVFWDKQDAFVNDTASVEPAKKDFVNLSIVSGPDPISGIEYTPVPNSVGLFDVFMNYTFTLSVHIYTNNAHLFKIANLALLIRSEIYKNLLKAAGLGFMDQSSPEDLSEFDETRYNLRSHMDIIFSYISVVSNVNVGQIDSYQATGTLGDRDVEIDVHKAKSP